MASVYPVKSPGMAMSEAAGSAATPTPLRLRVAAEVRAWRARRSMTQQQLAKALGVSQAQTSAKLRGLQPISLDEIESLSAIFGCTAEDLLRPALAVQVAPRAGRRVTSAQTRSGLRLATERIHPLRRHETDWPRRERVVRPWPMLALVS